MSHEIRQEGSDNFAFQDIHDSNFTIFVNRSEDYNNLVELLEAYEENFSLTSVDKVDDRLKISVKIEQLRAKIEAFKQSALAFTENFRTIDINTERLREAKNLLELGEFSKSQEILSEGIDQIIDDQAKLLRERERFRDDTLPKLKHNSEEFLILALSMPFSEGDPDLYTQTRGYFEKSILSFETHNNLFEYAKFLASLNQINEARMYWKRSWENFQNEMTPRERVNTLNNLALTYSYENDYETAYQYYTNAHRLATEIYQTDASRENYARIAYILNNLGLLQTNFDKNDEAESNLSGSLKIREELFSEDDFQSIDNLAVTHVNLGLMYSNKESFEYAENHYLKSLEIYENVLERSLFYNFQQIALIKNNLGDLYGRTDKVNDAETNYHESLEILNGIFRIEPLIVLPLAVLVRSNLAWFYQNRIPQKDNSIQFAFEALELAMPLVDDLAAVRTEFLKARQVLLTWGFTDEILREFLDDANSREETADT